MSFQVVWDALTRTITDIVNYIPSLVYGLVVLLVGYLVARIVRWITATLLHRLRFDALMERAEVSHMLGTLGVKMPVSALVAQAVFFLLMLSFLISATRLMGMEPVTNLLEQLFFFLPNLIAAMIVFIIGVLIARFVGNLVGLAAVGGGISYGDRLGKLVQYAVTLFVVVLALASLGVDTAILTMALTIMIAAFGLAIGLALGLGARSLVHHVLAGYYMRQRFPAGQTIEFGQTRGEVSGIGSVNTMISTEAGDIVVPNGLLVESLITAPRGRPEPPGQGPPAAP